jgi:bifunctional UDP-N-acetylglucosamine pyrophosphorylase/glucosamine-1-phosphate N-acetyltransferase
VIDRGRRVLVIPAAGLGSRLGGSVPKVLVPVAGVPMIDRVFGLYEDFVGTIVLVLHPSSRDLVERHVRAARTPVECVVQPSPTGMLDAILLARDVVLRASPSSVWITWCDQVGVDPRTAARLAAETAADPGAALVLPTVTCADPYIHLQRNAEGRITRVLHQREGDPMPRRGESDMGLFAMSADAYRDLLPDYAAEARVGGATGERNFLPFIPWAAAHGEVVTFPCTDPREAIGVNTPDDLVRVEEYLRSRG